MKTISISDKTIEYLPCSDNPLSSDVVFIKGDSSIWIYDVGTSDEAFGIIKDVISSSCEENKSVNIVISHFHKDHMGNLSRILDFHDEVKSRNAGVCELNVYVSANTFKYSHAGIVVSEKKTFCDDLNICLFPIPSSHAKGCLAMMVDDELVVLGDAIYPGYNSHDVLTDKKSYKREGKKYNVQILKEQIDVMRESEAKYLFIAHLDRPKVRREIIVKFLMSIYEKRTPGEPFIFQ